MIVAQTRHCGGRGKQVDDVAVNIFVHDFCDHLNISVGLIPRRGIAVSRV